jgi:hypothetical protein
MSPLVINSLLRAIAISAQFEIWWTAAVKLLQLTQRVPRADNHLVSEWSVCLEVVLHGWLDVQQFQYSSGNAHFVSLLHFLFH